MLFLRKLIEKERREKYEICCDRSYRKFRESRG